MGHGWWRPSSSKLEPLLSFTIRDDPVKGVKDIGSFVGAANFYCRHVKNFTFASAILTDLIKKNASWRWGDAEKKAFQDLKGKLKEVSVLGVPKPVREIIKITDACDIGGGGSLYQWQRLSQEVFASVEADYHTLGVDTRGYLKHPYPEDG